MLLIYVLLGLGLLGCVTMITAAAVMDWVHQNKIPSTKTAIIVKKKLGNGEYRVVSGIYANRCKKQNSNTWTAHEIDDELEMKFNGRRKIRINV